MITAKTKLCALIGNPVEHSMSPAMHNATFSELGLDYVYTAFKVETSDLGKAAEAMRALGIRGLNVTIPHKVDIIPFLDEIDPLAKEIGAVNTIVNNEGVLTGCNTDALGFLRSLTEKGVSPKGKKVVILGAGGVSRAICFVLAQNGAKLKILNRKEEFSWAEALSENINKAFENISEAFELNEQTLENTLYDASILVNATSVGMHPNIENSIVPRNLLKEGLAVFDCVYNPLKTRLLRDAEEKGALAIGGLDMLVWQGALAFEMWTGVKPPVELMKKEALEALGL